MSCLPPAVCNSSAVCKKLNRRMFFPRKLRSLKIDATILSLFYRSTIQSILSFCIAAWGGNIRYKDKCTMNRIIKKACKICSNINLPYFDELLLANTTSKIHAISIDVHHPIAAQIVLSSHRNKPIYLKCKKERYRKSFVPSGIRTLWKAFSLKVFYVLKKYCGRCVCVCMHL